MVESTLSPLSQPDSDQSGRQVGPASRAEYSAALKQVFCDLPSAARARIQKTLLAAAARGEIDFDGLLVARHSGQLRGAIWARTNRGRMASVWPPRVCGEEEETMHRLLDAMDDFLKQRQVRVAQALIQPSDNDGAARLEAGGYRGSTDLVYLVCLSGCFPDRRPESLLEFVPFSLDQQQRLADVMSRTYAGTYDFPELNEVCDAEDALSAYREAGVFCPERWFIVQEQGKDIGCLLLTDHPQDKQYELLYMGLVPEARGQSYGTDVTRRALWCAAQAGRRQLVLTVDAANHPALSVYSRLKFTEWDRRRVFLKVFADEL